jgi:hypothetical protein
LLYAVEWDTYLRFWKFYRGALIFHQESSEYTYKLIFGSTWAYVIFAESNPVEFQGLGILAATPVTLLSIVGIVVLPPFVDWFPFETSGYYPPL